VLLKMARHPDPRQLFEAIEEMLEPSSQRSA
jgi:hypothetical protein